jgi:hypothetical protein
LIGISGITWAPIKTDLVAIYLRLIRFEGFEINGSLSSSVLSLTIINLKVHILKADVKWVSGNWKSGNKIALGLLFPWKFKNINPFLNAYLHILVVQL